MAKDEIKIYNKSVKFLRWKGPEGQRAKGPKERQKGIEAQDTKGLRDLDS